MKQQAERFRKRSAIVALLVMAAMFVSCSQEESVGIIGAEELKKQGERPGPAKIVIVDTRTTFEFVQGRIPGAIHIPEESFRKMNTLLPSDKEVPLVFYCRGLG